MKILLLESSIRAGVEHLQEKKVNEVRSCEKFLYHKKECPRIFSLSDIAVTLSDIAVTLSDIAVTLFEMKGRIYNKKGLPREAQKKGLV